MKLQSRVLVLFLCIAVLVLVLIGGVLPATLYKQNLNQISSESIDQLRHIDFALSGFVSDAKDDVLDLSINDDVRYPDDSRFTNFLNASEATFRYSYTPPEQKIIDIFRDYQTTHPYVSSVYMGRENGASVRSYPRALPTKYDPRERPWYILAKEHPGQVSVTDPYKAVTTDDVNIGIVTPVLDQNGTMIGVVGADITLVNLTSYISRFNIDHEGELILVDKNGMILASRNSSRLFGNISDILQDQTPTFLTTNEGVLVLDGSYLIYYTSPELGWKIVEIVPFSTIEKEINDSIVRILLFVLLALFLLSVITLVALNYTVIRPLTSLTEVSRKIADTGDLDQMIETGGTGEIGSLARSFKTMVGKIHTDITERKKAEEALRESEEFNRSLVENLPDIIAIYDREGIVRFANKAGLQILGSPLSKVIGEPILSFVADYQKSDLEKKMRARLSGVAVAPYEVDIRTGSGVILTALLQAVPIRYRDEPVVLVLMTDITKRKQEEQALHENEQRLTSIYNTVGDSIFQLTVEPHEQYRFTSINSAFSRTTGIPSGHVIGRTVNEIIPEPALSTVREKYQQAIREKGIVRWEETSSYPSGQLTGEVSIAPIFDRSGNCTFLIGSVHDITERKQAEQKLLEAHRDLEKKVAERTCELSEANLRLQELDRLKSLFIASMSHELRTPLNSIIGFTGIMAKGLAGEINAEQKKQLGMVQDSARHLLALINDVIDISKIEADKIEAGVSTFNIADVILEVRATYDTAAQERGLVLTMEIPGPITVTSDERRIRQIIMNLVSNAIKFTDEGSVDVTVEQKGTVVEVSVGDTGIGIGKEDLEQLFRPFGRIAAQGRFTEGTGIGLYLSKKLARFLGGDITAESEPHAGSIFTFSFPVIYKKQEDL